MLHGLQQYNFSSKIPGEETLVVELHDLALAPGLGSPKVKVMCP